MIHFFLGIRKKRHFNAETYRKYWLLPAFMFCVVAVDGGASSGKSTASRLLVNRLPGGLLLDTGMHYRSLTHWILKEGIRVDDIERISRWVGHLEFGTWIENKQSMIVVNDRLVRSSALKSAEINANVSKVAAVPAVRQSLGAYQKHQKVVARSNGYNYLIVEGRDIGTVIFPDADHKFFLEADDVIRQKRRNEEGLTDSVHERDLADSARNVAPLACAKDAIRIDTTHQSPEEVLEIMVQKVFNVDEIEFDKSF